VLKFLICIVEQQLEFGFFSHRNTVSVHHYLKAVAIMAGASKQWDLASSDPKKLVTQQWKERHLLSPERLSRLVTDHKPPTKLFRDKTLDEISNPRLFRLNQRTLLWKFKIEHMPGKENYFSDATSRPPAGNFDTVDDKDEDNMDQSLATIYKPTIDSIRAVTWEMVKVETTNDLVLSKLIFFIQNGFSLHRQELEPELQ